MAFTPTLSESPTSSEVRTVLGDAARYVLELRSTPADKRTETFEADVRSGINTINELDPVMKGLEASEFKPESKGARGQAGFGEARQARSLGEAVTNNDEYRSWAEGSQEGRMPNVQLNSAEVRTLLDSTGDDNAALFRPVGTPFLSPQGIRQQRLFVRDLLSVVQTNLAVVPYIREVNSVTNSTGATATAQGGLKAEATMEFEQDTAIIQKITAWIPATTEVLQDAPTLQGYINTRLVYMVKLREEAQILNGPGTSPNIKGIRQFSGVQTAPDVANDLPAALTAALAKIENVDGTPDGVALNPLDYWLAVGERHSTQFDGGFGGGAPGTVPGITWGLPAVRTRSMEQGKYLAASWQLGATLYDRNQITVRQSDSHDTYFVYNKVAILCEERVGVAVHRPDFFVLGSISFS